MEKNRATKYLRIIIFNIFIITAICEIFFRIPFLEQKFLYQQSWNPRVVLHPDPMLEHIFKPSSKFRASEIYSEVYNAYGKALLGEDYLFETDKAGLREKELLPKKDNERLVLFLGDSLVAGSQVRKELTMSSVAEKILNDFAKENNTDVAFRTINGGIDGYDLVNSLENYKRLTKIITPDIVVLGVFINDIMPYENYFSSGMKIKHFLLKYSYTLRMLKVLSNYIKLELAEKENKEIHEIVTPQYERVLDRQKLSRLYPKYFPRTSFLVNKTTFSDTYPQRTLGWLEDRIIDDDLLKKLPVSPRPESEYESTAHVIKLIHDEVTKNNIPLLICLFPVPTAYDDHELHFAMEYYDIKEKSIDRQRPQRILSEAIRKQIIEPDVRLIDLTAALAAASKNSRAAIPMDCHFGAQGHRVVGDVVAEAIWQLITDSVH